MYVYITAKGPPQGGIHTLLWWTYNGQKLCLNVLQGYR